MTLAAEQVGSDRGINQLTLVPRPASIFFELWPRGSMLVLIASVWPYAVLVLMIDVIGKRHVNTGEAKQLDTLPRMMRLVGGSRAFLRLLSVRFRV